MSQIITIFTGLSLTVAVLGLIGLVSFKLDQWVKEIGVRKVLGASVLQLLGLFTSEMIKLILISLLVTIPLGYFATYLWLNGFSYYITINAICVGCFLWVNGLSLDGLLAVDVCRQQESR